MVGGSLLITNRALGEMFMTQGKGLFPSPKEIDFSCSCPDWAYMCKHVEATLYGIGARLDEDPGGYPIFFIEVTLVPGTKEVKVSFSQDLLLINTPAVNYFLI